MPTSTSAKTHQLSEPVSTETHTAAGVGATPTGAPLTAQTGLAALWPFPHAQAPLKRTTISPRFDKFISRVMNGQAGMVRGIFAPGVFSLPVVQQPADNSTFVSEKWGEVTQFKSAAENGVTGLLAHNFLSGSQFYKLNIGQDLSIVYGDGTYKDYEVTGISRFKKLTPSSLRSDFIDLQTDRKMTTAEVFSRFYTGKEKVTFQTCLEKEGLSNWGLVFIVAEPSQ